MLKRFSKKRKTGIAFSWLLVVICMGIIFYLSHQPSDASSELSLSVMGFFGKFFTEFIENIGHENFRSIAHWLEYCGLAALLYNAFLQTSDRPRPLISFAVAVIYCISDEIHQIFIPGRAFQISDMLVDAFGAAAGLIVCQLLYIIVIKITERKKRKTN